MWRLGAGISHNSAKGQFLQKPSRRVLWKNAAYWVPRREAASGLQQLRALLVPAVVPIIRDSFVDQRILVLDWGSRDAGGLYPK